MSIARSAACLTFSVTVGIALATETGLAQGRACDELTLVSMNDHREVHFVDFDNDGPSIGDRRIGHRRLVDKDGNVIADRVWTVTVQEVDDAGEPTVTASEAVTLFEDGNIFTRVDNRDPVNVDDLTTMHSNAQRPPQAIIGGTGAYAGATGTLEVIRGKDNQMTFVFALDCQ
ncbi:hypothetical protein [Bauldia sp.]|uniref:hypothetical protein n=1 Tax=Bauldia sp. TaxID=2575872 RepID=UPI003BAD9EF5